MATSIKPIRYNNNATSLALRYSLLALLSAIISAADWVLTKVTVSYFAVPSVVAAMWGGLLGGLLLLFMAGVARCTCVTGAGQIGRAWPWAGC